MKTLTKPVTPTYDHDETSLSSIKVAFKAFPENSLMIYRLYCSCTEGDHVSTAYRTAFSLSVTHVNAERVLDDSFIYDVARKESDAEEMFSLLVENLVTPCTLYDVIIDYIG